jgi:hypothetical protein
MGPSNAWPRFGPSRAGATAPPADPPPEPEPPEPEPPEPLPEPAPAPEPPAELLPPPPPLQAARLKPNATIRTCVRKLTFLMVTPGSGRLYILRGSKNNGRADITLTDR